MGLLELMTDEQRWSALVCAPAAGLVHGAVSLIEQDEHWVRPLRFSDGQIRALGSVEAWHPGLYRQMARTTAGVCVEFETDAREVALEVRVDGEPRGTRDVLALVDRDDAAGPQPHDGISLDIDDVHLSCVMPDVSQELICFSLTSSDPDYALGLQSLPGMERTRHVRIWLPALRGCVVRSVICDGSFIRPVAHRRVLLVLGDSIAQGFVAGDPAYAWPTLLARRLRLDVVNQGIGGQVFQPGTLRGVAGSVEVARIVVAYGENYRYETCMARRVSHDIRSYLADVAKRWPNVPTQVLTPIWHNEEASPSHVSSCFDQVPSFISAHASRHDNMSVIDGLELLEHDPDLMADGIEHPTELGNRQIAMRLNAVIRIPGLRPSSVGKRRKRKEPAEQEVVVERGVVPLPFDDLA